MHYLIGLAELKSNEVDKAVTQLQAAVAGDVAEDDARFELATALDRVGQWANSRVEYHRLATAQPQSQLVGGVRDAAQRDAREDAGGGAVGDGAAEAGDERRKCSRRRNCNRRRNCPANPSRRNRDAERRCKGATEQPAGRKRNRHEPQQLQPGASATEAATPTAAPTAAATAAAAATVAGVPAEGRDAARCRRARADGAVTWARS